MIGVIADSAEHDVVCEFFELFKTPWEFARKGRNYAVLLCAGDQQFEATAKLCIVYASHEINFDAQREIPVINQTEVMSVLCNHDARIPIYGRSVSFAGKSQTILKKEGTQECVAYISQNDGIAVARIGYGLFEEVRTLLTIGQPEAKAGIPALDLHIAFLRELIAACGIPFVEIPPAPEGFPFIACLTHDVDHPSIRQHKWDHTMLGFLYRASVGSMRKFLRRQISFRDTLANWVAVLKLPFVYLGLAKDFWREFAERYIELEREFRSTFFVIPFKDRPGSAAGGAAPSFRASGYAAQDIADIIRKLLSAGHEIGLHGIDSWVDSTTGREELDEIQRLTGAAATGVRMHWLYYDQNSPKILENAGAVYDSTFGYNGAVGYRAGTTQVYKPLETTQLLELPLHVMDTALFYPTHLSLSPKQAAVVLNQLQDNAVRFGGVLTVNWHDRSLAPERLWDAPYQDLLAGLKRRGAWFATAGQTVSWFRLRRSATFEIDSSDPETVSVKVPSNQGDNLPGLRLRTFKADLQSAATGNPPGTYFDASVDKLIQTRWVSRTN